MNDALHARAGGTRHAASRARWSSASRWCSFAATMPLWAESSWMREFVEIACYFIFAMMWNLLAGYGGMVSIGQQAFFGLGGYVMLMLGNLAGVNPFVAIPLAALATAAGRAAGVVGGVSPAGRLLRDRHLGDRRGVPPVASPTLGAWAAARAPASPRCAASSAPRARASPSGSRWPAWWPRSRCVYLFLRSKRGLALLAIRDNEVAAESAGHRRAAHQARGLRGRGLRRRPGRRAVLRGQPAHQPRRRVQRQLDRVRHLHGGDRRHRPHRGADRRRARSSGRSTSSSATTAPGT